MELASGTFFDGHYRIGELLGSGGMSLVYAAEDVQLGRQIALKLLKSSQDATGAQRLFREARAAARANHPAVVTVHTHGIEAESGRGYLVMERLYGEDLAARLHRSGPLPPRLVHRIGLEVADVLVSTHQCGTIHRDLKPTNLYLGTRGLREDEVRVLDFGVAKQLDLLTLTQPGMVLGTLGYMAPEQLMDTHADRRSDIYSLGMVLFECGTGRPAFAEQSLVQFAQELSRAAHEPPTRMAPDFPQELGAIIERCTAASPEARFQRAEHLRQALLDVESSL